MEKKKQSHLYVASCARDGGIYHYTIQEKELHLEEKLTLPEPLYMTLSHQRLYCVLEQPFEGSRESGVVSVELKNGFFGACSDPVGTRGEEGCHLCVAEGRVYVANYTSGSLCLVPDKLAQHQGRGPDPERQEGPHPHCVIPTPDGKFLCATDLGLDRILVYDKDLTLVSSVAAPEGCGPRHLLFSRDGKTLFCVNELQSGLSFYSYENGILTHRLTRSSLPRDFEGESFAAAIRRYQGRLYLSNRGHDSVAFVEEAEAESAPFAFASAGGSFPRDIFLQSGLLFSANERSDTVTVFSLEGGAPVSTGQVLFLKRPLAFAGWEA